MDYNYTAESSKVIQRCHSTANPPLYTGKVLGGTSSISVLVYERGNPRDFQKWSEASNDSTWCWKNVVPYYKKAEKLYYSRIDKLDTSQYGCKGYVSILKDHHKAVKKYLEAFRDSGSDVVADLNADTFIGYTPSLLASSPTAKQTAAYSYLRTAKHRPNLFVRKHTLVTKILINENKVAYGVEALIENNDRIRIYAKNKVIVCAGAIKSPQLLMLSGIGPKEELKNHKINVIADLPVGRNLQVQPGVLIEHKTEKFMGPPLFFNPFDTGAGFITGMTALKKTKKYPDYQTISFVQLNPKRMLKYCAFYYSYCGNICDKFYEATLHTESLYSIIVNLNSKSRGTVQLHSLDPEVPPKINYNLYCDETDLENLIDYVIDYLKIENSTFFRRIEAAMIDATPNCKNLKPRSREYWRCYITCMSTTVGRYTGTCSMGSVVDGSLRVYGVKNLHVADASVIPFTPSGGLYGPTVMIGEKLADMIKNEYNK